MNNRKGLTYKAFPSLDDLECGIIPKGYQLVVLAAEIEEKQGSIIVPDKSKEGEDLAGIYGLVVAVGAQCGVGDVWGEGESVRPGDRVIHTRYAGTRAMGNDGRWYRILSDKDVLASVAEHRPHRIEEAA